MDSSTAEALETSLADYLDNQSPVEAPAVAEGPRPVLLIDTLEKAAWAMRKIAWAQEKINEIERVAQAEIERIKAWVEQATASHRHTMEFFDVPLKEYHRRVLAENPRAKTIRLPHGTLEARSASAAPEVDGDAGREALTAWAQESAPEYVEMEPRLVWGGLKQALQVDTDAGQVVYAATGEIVPGVRIKPAETTFKVKPEVGGHV